MGRFCIMKCEALVVIQDVPQMSLCQVCPEPGHCCREIVLYEDGGFVPFKYKRETWQADAAADMERQDFPFVPVTIEEDLGDGMVSVKFTCPKLLDGRCMIYASRPQLCRDYVPGGGGICVFDFEKENE